MREVCLDDDATVRAHLKDKTLDPTLVHKTKAAVPGDLPAGYAPITFLADPNHASRTFGKGAYKAWPNTGKNKGVAGWVKKNFAYCMRRLREKGVGVLEAGLHIALHRHLFDDHEQCDGVWCAKKRGGAGSRYRPAHGATWGTATGRRWTSCGPSTATHEADFGQEVQGPGACCTLASTAATAS